MTSELVEPVTILRELEAGAVEQDAVVLDSLTGRLPTDALLRVAIGVAEALAGLHGRGLLHVDIRPANILVHLESGRAWLAESGSSAPVADGQAPKKTPLSSLAYVAPERTGRHTCVIDERADLYSLGVSLYQLATAKLPFAVSEPQQWLHAHLAARPIPPTAHADIPEMLQRILLKLLEKEPDDRYQTASGLAHDLHECQTRLATQAAVTPFALGRHDAPGRLLRRTALRGRLSELAELVAALERVQRSAVPEILLLSGQSGVGKSSLVGDLVDGLPHGTVVVSVKFEAREGDAPYAAMVEGFCELSRWLLAKPTSVLEEWRAALRSELGSGAAVIGELIPELQAILGPLPAAPWLPSKEAESRLYASFRQFLRTFAARQPPLVLFFDDLQWVDAPSLVLIEQLMLDAQLSSVLLIGAYRSEAVSPEHPLLLASKRWAVAGRAVSHVALAPLSGGDIVEVVSDVLLGATEGVADLARVVEEKTGGNPFFVRQFLMVLAEEQLLTFDQQHGAWVWDLPRIATKPSTDNLSGLLLERLARLPASTQRALELLACLGGRSTPRLLAELAEESVEAQAEHLRVAVRAGVISESGPLYVFSHDRLLTASYQRIVERERPALHLRIGRVLRSRPGAIDGEGLFDVVRHLNRAVELVSDADERIDLAKLNLEFARRSRSTAAASTVVEHLGQGLALLPADHWQRLPELSFDLTFARAESQFLGGQPAQAEALLADLATQELDAVRLGSVVSLRLALYSTSHRFAEGIETGLQYLRAAGAPWEATDQDELRRQYERLIAALGGRTVTSLLEQPALQAPWVRAAMEVCDGMLVAARVTNPQLLALLILYMATLSIEHGHSDISAHAYATLSIVLGPYFGEHELGLEFGKLGGQLAEREENRFVARARLLMGSIVAPRTQGPHAGRDWLVRGRDAADRAGDLVCSTYTRNYIAVSLLGSGAPLEEAERETQLAMDYAARNKFALIAGRLRIIRSLIRGLRDPRREPGSLSDEELDEAAYEQGLGAKLDRYYYWNWRVEARYYAGQFTDARTAARRSRELGSIAPNSQEETELLLFGALAETACADPNDPAEALDITAVDERELVAWAERCPATFASKAALVSAERARLGGRDSDAQRGFEKAAQLARQHRLLHEEALAHELASRFYAARGITSVARAKLSLARSCYLRWGALAKVVQLDALAESAEDPSTVPPLVDSLEQLDVKVLVSALEAVSSSLELEKLIQALMTGALQHAAAERGLLVLLSGELREPRIRARASSEATAIQISPEDVPVTPDSLPQSILNYVLRSGERVSTRDGVVPPPFREDVYFELHEVRSLLCLPIVVRGKAVGAMYLENTRARHSHGARGLAVLDLMASQAAISLENAQLYAGLQEAQQRMARAERVSRTASFSWRPQTQESKWSDEVSNIYGLEGRPTLAGLRARTHPDDRALFDAIYKDSARYDGQLVELRLSMPDGAIRHVAIIGSRLGTADEFVGTIRDVTEAKHAEEALQRTQAALTDMARMASLAEMSVAIAHEMNQPVTAIGLDAGTCLRKLSDERLDIAKARAVVERIQRDANRAGVVVQRLRALFRKAEGARVAVNMNDAITEVVTLARSRMRAAEATLHLELSPELPVTLGDRVQLQQVVMNLLNNALDAMSKKPTPRNLTIRTLLARTDQLRCEVQDNGPGLSEVERFRIFEPFYTTKLEGMGIGLSICSNIVVSHGGELAAYNNTAGPGSTFYFTLPRA